ncbi:hypothetical protein [Pseudoalteromonas sp. SCSIO 43201]|uniref:hypothetical protein n=1 Tax=Pseudoalteromonas sp. SCSIO 43201 TaxID=2822842 RepID=UPI0020761441|nr:hypothetical protein [Pseudoalteromonas sp. SCSIO 43201]
MSQICFCSSEQAWFIVAQLLLRSLGGRSSTATKTHSGKQNASSKGLSNNKIVGAAFGWQKVPLG